MSDGVEQQYLYVLQNIEAAFATVYREEPKMTDHTALFAVETLIKTYQAEAQGRTAALPQFQPVELEAYEKVRSICDWRLGRGGLTDDDGKEIKLADKPNAPEEIVACLKRIKKSIEFWQRRGGRRAYFDFIGKFLK